MQSQDLDTIIKTWQSYGIKSSRDLEKYLDSFRVIFAYNSSKIENPNTSYQTTREIFSGGSVSGYTGDIRTLFEQHNQKACYDAVLSHFDRQTEISIEFIKELHLLLTAGTYDSRRYIENGERSGEFKKHDYVTGINEVGSPPEDVEKNLQELIGEVNSVDITDTGKVIKTAAYLHAKFEYIHPFADGNGRVGRTLLNYFLMRSGFPPVVIYDEDKPVYYNALEVYDSREEIYDMEQFIIGQMIKTWKRLREN